MKKLIIGAVLLISLSGCTLIEDLGLNPTPTPTVEFNEDALKDPADLFDPDAPTVTRRE